MKKIKTTICIVLLAICLSSNIFASTSLNSVVNNIFGGIMNAVVSAFNDSDGNCPIRTCQDCKPNQPDCRPPEDKD